MLDLLRMPQQQALLIMQLAMFLGYTCELSVVPLHANLIWDATPGQIGFMFSAVSLTGFVFTPLGGYIADEYGRRAAILPAALVTAAGATVLPFATEYYGFLGAFLLWAAGASLLTPGVAAYAADIAPPDQRGAALSLSRQAADIAFLVGPLSFCAVAELANNEASMFMYSGIMLASTGAFYRMAPPEDAASAGRAAAARRGGDSGK